MNESHKTIVESLIKNEDFLGINLAISSLIETYENTTGQNFFNSEKNKKEKTDGSDVLLGHLWAIIQSNQDTPVSGLYMKVKMHGEYYDIPLPLSYIKGFNDD